ncbi:MAG: 23S rRNA (guanosine(2251)-2'-O)-methyltransferase RlmB [Myxococcales bacterium]|jgi:23S rRNA (guanosine2251-2'-O)-methyltransferase|nr:23S rRNA (guanosine(2251)-2'-O)-methyltransferase RlmB [Myxococcales bacterium]
MSQHIYGVHPVLEVLRFMPQEVEVVFVSGDRAERNASDEVSALCRAKNVRVERSSKRELAQLSEGGVHQGVALRLRAPSYADFDALAQGAAAQGKDGLLLMLDGIEDPHNLGALCRSASALGAQGVIIAKDRAVGITPTAIKSSAGALPLLPMARVTNLSRALEALRALGFWSVAADMSGDRPPEGVDYSTPTLVVVGSEGKGIRKSLLDKCDFRVRIPMVGPIASLNASVAGAVLMAEVARQRRQKR